MPEIEITTLTPEYESHVRELLCDLADEFLLAYLSRVTSEDFQTNDEAMELANRLGLWKDNPTREKWERLWDYVAYVNGESDPTSYPLPPKRSAKLLSDPQPEDLANLFFKVSPPKVPVAKVATVNNNSVEKKKGKKMSKSVSPMVVFKWAQENGCADLSPKEQRERFMLAQKGQGGPAKPREKRVYSTVLVLVDGRTLVLPNDSERASNAAIAALSLLASHGIDYSEVASVVRAPAMTFEEFAGSDE